MTIGKPLWAIIDPRDGTILGDGECCAMYSTASYARAELARVKFIAGFRPTQIVRVVIRKAGKEKKR